MIDKSYWERVAQEWKKEDDGLPPIPEIDIKPLPLEEEELIDDEIKDILADLGLDE